MKKYHQLLLFVTTVVSLSLLLVYRHEYNRLHYVLEVFNFFGHPCNISNLEYSDHVLGYQDWGAESLWQENENIYIYSAFWSKNQGARAIVLNASPTEAAKNCYLWFEDKEKPVIGKFKFTEIGKDKKNGQVAYFYYCLLTISGHEPYAVSFGVKKKNLQELKKVLLTSFRNRKPKTNTTICVASTDFNKSYFVEFISYHKLVGIDHFIFYENNIPHRLTKIVSNLSNRLGIQVNFRSWNYPKLEGSLSRSIVEKDCLLRTTNFSEYSVTLEMNEFIVPSASHLSFTETLNVKKGSNTKMPERISLPVQTFCIESTHKRKPIVLQNVDVSYNDDNNIQYVHRSLGEEATVITHAVVKDVISIHKYIKCSQKPVRVYRDNSILKFSMDLTRSTLVQLYLHDEL